MAAPLFVSRNGALIPPADAAISVFNPAIYGAYGVYESMQVRNGVVFEQDAHLARLAHSAEIIGLPLPAGTTVIGRWIAEVLAANRMADCAECTLRLFVVGPENGGETCAYLWPQPSPVFPPAYYTAGADAITFEAQRYLPQSKSLNALASYMARRAANAQGVHEGLLYHDGRLTEGSNSNLFAVVDGTVLTPPAHEVLSGVTRDLVIMLAAGNGIPLEQTALPLSSISVWQECFITSTSRHIMPVTRIDGQPVGDGRVGPLTRRISALFEAFFAAYTHAR
jgi:branched-subunit amino acid aminotransferase/4-amino-4-deoxychorismate lyase